MYHLFDKHPYKVKTFYVSWLGDVQNAKALKRIGGEVSVDGKTLYEFVAEVAKSRKGNSYIYTPSVILTAPKLKQIKLKGQAEYQPNKIVDVMLTLSGVSKEPIKTQGKNINILRIAYFLKKKTSSTALTQTIISRVHKPTKLFFIYVHEV